MRGPLRNVASLLEMQKPGDDYSLVHIRPSEAAMLEEITGNQGFVPGVGVKKFAAGGAFAGGGAVPASFVPLYNAYSELYNKAKAGQLPDYNNYAAGATGKPMTDQEWVNSPYYAGITQQLINAVGNLGPDDAQWLQVTTADQSGRLNDPLYGPYAKQAVDAMKAKMASIGVTPTTPSVKPTPSVQPPPNQSTQTPATPNPTPVIPVQTAPLQQYGKVAAPSYNPRSIYKPPTPLGQAPTPVINPKVAMTDQEWVKSPEYASTTNSVLSAVDSLGADALPWLQESAQNEYRRANDPLYGSFANSAIPRINARIQQLSPNTQTGQGAYSGTGAAIPVGMNSVYGSYNAARANAMIDRSVAPVVVNSGQAGFTSKGYAKGGRVGGLAQYSHAVRNAGRGGDTQLAYVKPEHQELLKKMGGSGGVNPTTGLQEYGLFKSIGKIFKGVGKAVTSIVKSPIGQILLPVALTILAPGIGTAIGMSASAAGSAAFTAAVVGVGTTAANKLTGASWGQALKAGAFAGATAGVFKGAQSGNWIGGGAQPAAGAALGSSAVATQSLSPAIDASGIPSSIPVSATQVAPLQQLAGASSVAGSAASASPFVAPGAAPPVTTPVKPAGLFSSLTEPFAFKDTPGLMGSIGRAVANPLTAGGLALMAMEKPKNNPEKYTDYLEQAKKDAEASNKAYMLALANRGPYREQVGQQVDTNYGFRPESTFWRDIPPKAVAAAAGGSIGYKRGGLVQLREFSGPVNGPGGGQDDKVYLPNAQLADGEFVIDATTAADLGDGSVKEGHKKLEQLRSYVKKTKGRTHAGPIPKKVGGLKQLLAAMG